MERSIIVLIIIVVICYIQTLLSKAKSKLPGLILPAVSLISLGIYSVTLIPQLSPEVLLTWFITFLILNIPTLILLIIYRFNRKKIDIPSSKKKSD